MMEYVQRELPYVRSFVLRSVYGVLRQEGITFGEEEPGRVIAEWREDGTDVSLSMTALYMCRSPSNSCAGRNCCPFGRGLPPAAIW